MIKHFIDAEDGHYLCNKACNTTKEKEVFIESEVTCLNCLKKIKAIKDKLCANN